MRTSGLPFGAAAAALWFALWFALLAGCAPRGPGEIRYATGSQASETADGLHRVKSPFGVNSKVFVRPGANLEGYDQVMIEPVQVRYTRRSSRQLSPENDALLERAFHDALAKQIGKSEIYSVVEAPGPNVLRLRASIVDLDVVAPPDTLPSSRTEVYVSMAGAMTALMELSDSVSEQVLVRAADRQQVSDVGGAVTQTSKTSNLADAKILFRHWALRVRGWLDHVREVPPLPAG